jgi:hypothetical protein
MPATEVAAPGDRLRAATERATRNIGGKLRGA